MSDDRNAERTELERSELKAENGELLADREAMSVIAPWTEWSDGPEIPPPID